MVPVIDGIYRAYADFYGILKQGIATFDMAARRTAAAEVEADRMGFARGKIENWGDSAMVVSSPRTDTSTDVEIDDSYKMVEICLIMEFKMLNLCVYGVLWECFAVGRCASRCHCLRGFFYDVKGQNRGPKGFIKTGFN